MPAEKNLWRTPVSPSCERQITMTRPTGKLARGPIRGQYAAPNLAAVKNIFYAGATRT